VVDKLAGNDSERSDLFGGARPAVRLDEADDEVTAPFGVSMAFLEHRDGLAGSGDRAEVDPGPPRRHDGIGELVRTIVIEAHIPVVADSGRGHDRYRDSQTPLPFSWGTGSRPVPQGRR